MSPLSLLRFLGECKIQGPFPSHTVVLFGMRNALLVSCNFLGGSPRNVQEIPELLENFLILAVQNSLCITSKVAELLSFSGAPEKYWAVLENICSTGHQLGISPMQEKNVSSLNFLPVPLYDIFFIM